MEWTRFESIDIAWNCAISLRPLQSGEDDPHQMVSTYADWDVSAKLPLGVDEVRKYLEEVDNVPLLVSLYTDTTKERTKQMLEVFQEYSDTVLAICMAHLQLLHLIAFGELVIHFKVDLVKSECGGADKWFKVIRCGALKDYSGPARISAGIVVFSVFVMSSVVSSISFVKRFEPMPMHPPWEHNFTWQYSLGHSKCSSTIQN